MLLSDILTTRPQNFSWQKLEGKNRPLFLVVFHGELSSTTKKTPKKKFSTLPKNAHLLLKAFAFVGEFHIHAFILAVRVVFFGRRICNGWIFCREMALIQGSTNGVRVFFGSRDHLKQNGGRLGLPPKKKQHVHLALFINNKKALFCAFVCETFKRYDGSIFLGEGLPFGLNNINTPPT